MNMQPNTNLLITDSLSTKPNKDTDLVIIKNFAKPQNKNIGIYQDYARAHSVYIIPPIYTRMGYMCMTAINPRGDIIGEQKATHINSKFFSGIKKDDNINIIETPFSKIFLAVDTDIFKPEIIRIAAMLGATLIVNLQYVDKNDYNDSFISRGPWQQAQQNCIYIVNVNNISSNIIGPCMTTQDLSGYIEYNISDLPLSAKLIHALRDEAYSAFPVFDTLNPHAYQNHINELER